MIDVALLSVMRRWHHRDGMPIREIARRTGLSRNTVRKYLASGDVEPKYPKRKAPSKLDDYSNTLASWLHREAHRSRMQRRSVEQLFYKFVQLGYTGSYWLASRWPFPSFSRLTENLNWEHILSLRKQVALMDKPALVWN